MLISLLKPHLRHVLSKNVNIILWWSIHRSSWTITTCSVQGGGNYSRFSRRRCCAGKWNQVQQSVLLNGGAVVTCVHPLDSHSSTIFMFALDKTLKSPQTVMGWRDFMSALRQTPSWTSRHWLWLCEAGEQHLKCHWFKRTVLTSYVKSITHQHNPCDCIKNTTNNNHLEISC